MKEMTIVELHTKRQLLCPGWAVWLPAPPVQYQFSSSPGTSAARQQHESDNIQIKEQNKLEMSLKVSNTWQPDFISLLYKYFLQTVV